MYLTRSEYDRGVNTFSPEGRLFQVSFSFGWIIEYKSCFGTMSGPTNLCVFILVSCLVDPFRSNMQSKPSNWARLR